MWVLAEENGLIIQFDPYQGAKCTDWSQSASSQTWDLGEMTVLQLGTRRAPGRYQLPCIYRQFLRAFD